MSTTKAANEANRAVSEALKEHYARREFTITRFGRHRDGYLHAFVAIKDQPPVYVICRWGSWQIPRDPQPGYRGYNGPELRDVLAPYSTALAENGRKFERATQTRQEAQDAAANSPEDTRVDGQATTPV